MVTCPLVCESDQREMDRGDKWDGMHSRDTPPGWGAGQGHAPRVGAVQGHAPSGPLPAVTPPTLSLPSPPLPAECPFICCQGPLNLHTTSFTSQSLCFLPRLYLLTLCSLLCISKTLKSSLVKFVYVKFL